MKISTILFVIATLVSCTTVQPEKIKLGNQVYIQGPTTDAGPLPGLPNMGKHQLVLATSENIDAATYRIPIGGCVTYDLVSTGIGLAKGFSEANPVGITGVIIFSIGGAIYEKQRAEHGHIGEAYSFSAIHCAGGIWNTLKIL